MPTPPRLLLVDDEERNLSLLEAYLAPLGCTLTRASGGQEALQAFEKERPDLILLDVVMPDLDGLDVLTHIRASEQGTRVPIILVTGYTEREERLRGFEAGADEFLEKPVDRALLLARVRTLLLLNEARSELRQRNALLERLQQEQREMTAFLVHDLKNPLSIVNLNLAWVKDSLSPMAPDVDEAVNDALDASARLKRMLEELLAVARIEAVDAPLTRVPVDLSELLAEVVRAHTREALDRRVSFRVEAEPGLFVSADRAVVQRILENLIRNALRYTPTDGWIGLATRGGASVEIRVSNTGPPIPFHEQRKIFEKFKRSGDAPLAGGHMGLGLYFCKRAMDAHQGSIMVADAPGWPVSFLLRFPKD
jgi:signal transduction histidine kinase